MVPDVDDYQSLMTSLREIRMKSEISCGSRPELKSPGNSTRDKAKKPDLLYAFSKQFFVFYVGLSLFLNFFF